MSADLFEHKLDVPHRVKFTLGAWDIETEFTCGGDETSLCRQVPDDLTCDCDQYVELARRADGVWQHKVWSEDPAEPPIWHAMRPGAECEVLHYLEAEPFEGSYRGDTVPAVSGPVDVAWDNHAAYYVWRLAVTG